MRYILLAIFLIVFSTASAQDLVIRADKNQPQILPAWSKMPSTSPACSDKGIATKYLSLFGEERLHPAVMQHSKERSVFSNYFESDLSISDLHLTESQQTIFALNYRGGTEGIYRFSNTAKLEKIVAPKEFPDAIAMSRPSIVKGKVLFRSLNKDGLHTIYHGSEVLLNEAADIAYLYLPTSKNDQIVLKIGNGNPGEVSQQNQDKILSIQSGKKTVVARDKDSDPFSKFLGFDNSPIPDGNGGVAFVAQHEDFGRSLWYFLNSVPKLIYSERMGLGELEYFSPAVNARGDLVFRLIQNKKRSVVKWSNSTREFSTLMRQGQDVEVNEKNIRVIDRKSWPAFAGKPCITKNGTVYVHAVLENSQNFENEGSAVFKF